MRTKQLITIGLIGVFAALAVYAWREFNRTHKSLVTVQSDYTVQATALVHEFLSNEEAACDKYRDKILTVTGMVKWVDRVEGDCIIVLGDTASLSASVRCLVDSAQVKYTGSLRPSDTVTVKGVFTGFKNDDTGLLGSDVELNRCVVGYGE